MSRVMRGTVVVGSTDSLSKSEELWRLCIQHSESQDLCRAPLRVDLGQDPRLPAPWRTFRFANLDFQLWRCGVQGRPAFILRVMPESDPPAILKLLADVNLREAHSLTDGSEVRVSVPGDGRPANTDRGVCIYCTVRPAVDDEHVFPYSWHPDGLPAGFNFLTQPSCRECNEKYEHAERKFAQTFLLAVDRSLPEVAGVAHRRGRLESIMRNVKYVPTPAGRLDVPRLLVRLSSGVLVPASPAVSVPADAERLINEKLIRGLYHTETGVPLGPSAEISPFRPTEVDEDTRAMLDRLLWESPFARDRLAPGLRYGVISEGTTSIWIFLLWGQFALASELKNAPVPIPRST